MQSCRLSPYMCQIMSSSSGPLYKFRMVVCYCTTVIVNNTEGSLLQEFSLLLLSSIAQIPLINWDTGSRHVNTRGRQAGYCSGHYICFSCALCVCAPLCLFDFGTWSKEWRRVEQWRESLVLVIHTMNPLDFTYF